MKINISKTINNMLLNRARPGDNGLHRTISLFKAFRAAAKINSFNTRIPKSDRLYLKMAIDYYDRIIRASAQNEFIAAYSLTCPVEIFYAMDIVPFQMETTAWLLAMLTDDTSQMLVSAGEAGLATEICSVHRLVTGVFAMHLLPRPDTVIWTNIPCENTAKSGPLFCKLNKCPGFFLDHPYKNTPEEIEYLESEYKRLISFLENRSGYKLDQRKLAEAVTRSNEQIELYRQISRLRKNIPSPFPSFTFLRAFMIQVLFGGQPGATVYLKTLRDELNGRIIKNKDKDSFERYRLINLNLPPLYFMDPLKNIFREYGAVDVINPFFLEWREGALDPLNPLNSLAVKSYMNPLMRICGSLDPPILDTLKQYVAEYKIDGAINYAHIGCGAFGGASRLVRDTLRQAGVPTLDLSCDITDPTVISAEEMRDQLTRFFELLEDR
ncbi:MAG: 2-hydroxyacyl-CoA dehydratase [Dehalococcoidales bacterium]|nr:2-hydroxyacyl-CoA dehydratase [Dehalococcoidales bacterium]